VHLDVALLDGLVQQPVEDDFIRVSVSGEFECCCIFLNLTTAGLHGD
jgi:hypothetical protein